MALDEETALERVRSASTAMAEWGDKNHLGRFVERLRAGNAGQAPGA